METIENVVDLLKSGFRFSEENIQPDLRNANLRYADLRYADLRNANLRNADLDFSCWPLWCGSLEIKVSARFARQLVYHLCSLNCEDQEFIELRESLLPFANKFHRVNTDDIEPLE